MIVQAQRERDEEKRRDLVKQCPTEAGAQQPQPHRSRLWKAAGQGWDAPWIQLVPVRCVEACSGCKHGAHAYRSQHLTGHSSSLLS
jgi:hypothetical protein